MELQLQRSPVYSLTLTKEIREKKKKKIKDMKNGYHKKSKTLWNILVPHSSLTMTETISQQKSQVVSATDIKSRILQQCLVGAEIKDFVTIKFEDFIHLTTYFKLHFSIRNLNMCLKISENFDRYKANDQILTS